MIKWEIREGDCIHEMSKMEHGSVQCCVTSPPYWQLRDYGVDGQIGLERTLEEYIQTMVNVFSEVRRVLAEDGTLWLNMGDTYNRYPHVESHTYDPKYAARNREHGYPARDRIKNLKEKDLVGLPWRVAFALQADGWTLRQDIIWEKSNPMPESVSDRCTKAHEYIFLFSKSKRYYFDAESIKEPVKQSSVVRSKYGRKQGHKWENGPGGQSINTGVGWGYADGKARSMPRTDHFDNRNKRSVWRVATHSFKEAHFATFPPKLIMPCIDAGCPPGGTVFDPFAGAGTTGLVACDRGRDFIGIELNPEYCDMARSRIVVSLRQGRLF